MHPDDINIKVVVKYAHKKLDPKHVQDCRFDLLSFAQLVAGEFELISRPGVFQEERDAYISMAKTISYHKQYLGGHDLRNGNDHILKKVELNIEQWSANLGEQLHSFYHYRTISIMRERMQAQRGKMYKQLISRLCKK